MLMARKKRESRVLKKAESRLTGVRSIDPKLDLGDGISVAALHQATVALKRAQDEYHQNLADGEGALGRIKLQEPVVADLSERILTGVATKFGKDSAEYGQAGGKRKSERARRGQGLKVRKAARAAAQASSTNAQPNGTPPTQPVRSNGTPSGQSTNGVNGQSTNGAQHP